MKKLKNKNPIRFLISNWLDQFWMLICRVRQLRWTVKSYELNLSTCSELQGSGWNSRCVVERGFSAGGGCPAIPDRIWSGCLLLPKSTRGVAWILMHDWETDFIPQVCATGLLCFLWALLRPRKSAKGGWIGISFGIGTRKRSDPAFRDWIRRYSHARLTLHAASTLKPQRKMGIKALRRDTSHSTKLMIKTIHRSLRAMIEEKNL